MFCKNCGKELKEGSVFCPNCGTKAAEEPEEKKEAQEPRRDAGEGTGAGVDGDLIRRIIGKNEDYYLAQFDRIRSGEKGRFNWASLILGIMHAGYRGVWKEWLRAVRIPLIVEAAAQLLSGAAMFLFPVLGTALMAVSWLAAIGLFAMQVLFAARFNRVYMAHVEAKAASGDGKSDVSAARAVIAYAALAAATLLVTGVSSALSGAALMYSIQQYSVGETEPELDFGEDLPEQEDSWELWEEDASAEDMEEELEFEENHLMGIAGFEWTDSYQRKTGPSAWIYVSWADESSVQFAAGVGASGSLAYLDLRDCEAFATEYDKYVYTDPSTGYELSIFCLDTGGISISENMDSPFGVSMGGEYVPEADANYPACEFVFPDSDTVPLEGDDCIGLGELECMIARNEIYARYGRMFSDERLQNYFDSCSWYAGRLAPGEIGDDMLSEVEQYNLSVIVDYESSMGFR